MIFWYIDYQLIYQLFMLDYTKHHYISLDNKKPARPCGLRASYISLDFLGSCIGGGGV
jgi:hypothetical protein